VTPRWYTLSTNKEREIHESDSFAVAKRAGNPDPYTPKPHSGHRAPLARRSYPQ